MFLSPQLERRKWQMDRVDCCLNFSYILPGQCLIKSASFINKVSCWLNYVHLCGNFESLKGYELQGKKKKKKKDTINIQISKSLAHFLMEEIFTLTQYLRRLILARKGDKKKEGLVGQALAICSPWSSRWFHFILPQNGWKVLPALSHIRRNRTQRV